MIVVADASPLIFLAKLRQLDLIPRLLPGDILIPRVVCAEVMRPGIDPVEADTLTSFLGRCSIRSVPRPRSFASAMSAADNAALTLAVRSKASFLLCDERVTRVMAENEGIRPLGTLGILLRSCQAGRLTVIETRRMIDLLIRSHGLRIGVEVYQAVLARLEASPGAPRSGPAGPASAT